MTEIMDILDKWADKVYSEEVFIEPTQDDYRRAHQIMMDATGHDLTGMFGAVSRRVARAIRTDIKLLQER